MSIHVLLSVFVFFPHVLLAFFVFVESLESVGLVTYILTLQSFSKLCDWGLCCSLGKLSESVSLIGLSFDLGFPSAVAWVKEFYWIYALCVFSSLDEIELVFMSV